MSRWVALLLVGAAAAQSLAMQTRTTRAADALAWPRDSVLGTPATVVPTVEIPQSTPLPIPTVSIPTSTATKTPRPTPRPTARHKAKPQGGKHGAKAARHSPAPRAQPTATPTGAWITAFLTSYCPGSAGWLSSSGETVFYGMLANNYYPFGTHVYIPVIGLTGVVEDHIGYGAAWNHFDVWSPVCYSTPTGYYPVDILNH